jgi:hypothetical protein
VTRAVAAPLTHLRHLTDAGGLYEHAERTTVRRAHGYCVDDVARALVVVMRAVEATPADEDLREQYLSFLLLAQAEDGRFRNRRSADLSWTDAPTVEDCWGRALWGLGTVVSTCSDPRLRAAALTAFDRGAAWSSPWSRAAAFAALGAAEVLRVAPGHEAAERLLRDAIERIGRPRSSPDWPWPEGRLRYANPVLAEALLAAGAALDEPQVMSDGLSLLRWLLDVQTRDGHLSVVPAAGRGPADADEAGFDQQPIEVAALADACARAYDLTGGSQWSAAVELCAAWFFGENDSATVMYDDVSGGGCDGLERGGRNENQGAESTLALLSTLQQARRLAAATS